MEQLKKKKTSFQKYFLKGPGLVQFFKHSMIFRTFDLKILEINISLADIVYYHA